MPSESACRDCEIHRFLCCAEQKRSCVLLAGGWSSWMDAFTYEAVGYATKSKQKTNAAVCRRWIVWRIAG